MNPSLKLFSFPTTCERIRSHCRCCIVDMLRNRIGRLKRACVLPYQLDNRPTYLIYLAPSWRIINERGGGLPKPRNHFHEEDSNYNRGWYSVFPAFIFPPFSLLPLQPLVLVSSRSIHTHRIVSRTESPGCLPLPLSFYLSIYLYVSSTFFRHELVEWIEFRSIFFFFFSIPPRRTLGGGDLAGKSNFASAFLPLPTIFLCFACRAVSRYAKDR